MSKSMFERTIDFKMEETENSYAACRALSIRARDINSKNKQYAIDAETESAPNPTALALTDYSIGRIVLAEETENDS
ncbi:MAG: hypothetical protein CME16_06330 [Gemmatimonadetes bacterium]|nr:hypothetical protein [Gemmatimonadota bacterium]